MCGIVGIVNVDRRPVEYNDLKVMNDIMRHRGPDGEGFYVEGPVGLAHRRLSIIDIEGGKQPMSNEDGTVWITYNGEVYNFKELQKELEAKGHIFKTRSDTEVIIHAYEEYGERCVNYLRGMFAFGIWDNKKHRLFLARDRVGIKPLYYFIDDGKIIFASEIKAILQDKTVSRELDSSSLYDYFSFGYVPSPKSIFKKINKLLPGHYIMLDFSNSCNGKIKALSKQYWDLEVRFDNSISELDWIEGLREVIFESVKMRLISEVPLGAFLSGGIDSSVVVAMMSRAAGNSVKTFSIGFEEEDYSELDYARTVAKKFNTEHFEMIVKPDAIEILPRLAWQFDEPFADSSAIPTFYVSKMAREKVTVVLSGDGGDEPFAGYNRYDKAVWFNKKANLLPELFRTVLLKNLLRLIPQGTKGKGFFTLLSMTSLERYRNIMSCFDTVEILKMFSGDFLQKLNGYKDNIFEEYYGRPDNVDYLAKILYVDTKTYLPEDILTKVDRTSMLNSLETRVPLLDHKVLEFAARIPSSLKIKDNKKKYILKQSMEGILPEKILHRGKMGFGVPLEKWFRGNLLGYTRDILLGRKSTERGFFDKRYVEKLLIDHQSGKRYLSERIWSLVFFESWCQQWLDSKFS